MPAQELVGLDNAPEEWQASLSDWLEEGERMHDAILREVNEHRRVAREKQSLATNLGKVLKAMGRDVNRRRPGRARKVEAA